MASSYGERLGNFSDIYRLISTLSSKKESHDLNGDDTKSSELHTGISHPKLYPDHAHTNGRPNRPNRAPSSGLGDFSQIWQYLGTSSPVEASPHSGKETSPKLHPRTPIKIEYTSDGAMYAPPSSTKKLQWRDEVNDGSLTDVAPTHSEEETPKLTKKQRKNQSRKARRKLLASQARHAISDMEESEAEMPPTPRNPAAKASVHTLPVTGKKHTEKLVEKKTEEVLTAREIGASGHSQGHGQHENVVAVPLSDKTNIPKTTKAKFGATEKSEELVEAGRRFLARYNSEPPERSTATSTEQPAKKQWPVSQPFGPNPLHFLPSSMQPDRKPRHASAPRDLPKVTKDTEALAPQDSAPPDDAPRDSVVEDEQPALKAITDHVSHQTPPRQTPPNTIAPLNLMSGEDRQWHLLLHIIRNFGEDRHHLVRPSNLTTHSNDPAGIHVFVDASNIFIGFMDQLKKARNIPPYVRVPRVEPSFDALALLMERRRPVAKRVLAGSNPIVPAFDVARTVGYECAILDKVYKARELTERQRFFMEQDERAARRSKQRKGMKGGGWGSEGYTSGSAEEEEFVAPTHAKEKFVEQGVDEILHLKILESIVDAGEKNPPSTIVLATGDAAQAEYSGGFMRMVERALEKGWKVEVVSWSANISGMYKRAAFRRKWGKKFQIIELDDYAEELLDM